MDNGIMTAPRVWVGHGDTKCPARWEMHDETGWEYASGKIPICFLDVFVPLSDVRGLVVPTADVRDLPTLATCKVVDW